MGDRTDLCLARPMPQARRGLRGDNCRHSHRGSYRGGSQELEIKGRVLWYASERHVGGLSDTIVDATEWTIRGGSAATGFAFREATTSAMLGCLDRAIAFYARPTRWRKMQRRAMSRWFDWSDSARRYFAIYRKIAPNAAAIDFERDAPPSALRHSSVYETRHQHEQHGKASADNILPLTRQAG